MSIFGFIKKKGSSKGTPNISMINNPLELANLVLNSIEEGVIIVSSAGIVTLANPAAMRMLGATDINTVYNLQLSSILHLENGEGLKIEDNVNPILKAMEASESYSSRDFVLVSMQQQRRPVAICVVSVSTGQNERIITLRDITRELEEESEQTEFISTASHEMRTPVASIEGYLGLALNPKTATVDDRARKYLEEAHASSKHLGRLFKDLLDVTKLDDKKIRVHLSPIEVSSVVRSIANGQVPQMSEKGIHYTFGSNSVRSDGMGKTLNQEVYASVDIDFLREAINNLVENAVKYTASGGGIWVNVRGDDDRVLINVTDTGIGISPDDLKHVFQKFYRADNSQTRTVGGTGLGLYLVKQRVEAMGGKVWAESSFGEGSTFYLSFPRITAEEYQRRKQIASNIENMNVAGNQTETTQSTPQQIQEQETLGRPSSASQVAPAPATPTIQTEYGSPVQTPVAAQTIQTQTAATVQVPQAQALGAVPIPQTQAQTSSIAYLTQAQSQVSTATQILQTQAQTPTLTGLNRNPINPPLNNMNQVSPTNNQ